MPANDPLGASRRSRDAVMPKGSASGEASFHNMVYCGRGIELGLTGHSWSRPLLEEKGADKE